MKLFKILFYLSLIVLLITGSIAFKNSFLLKTPHAPLGMLSLQLNTSVARQKQIVREWDSVYINQQVYERDTVYTKRISGLTTAKKQTQANDLLAFAYLLFLSLLFYKYRDKLAAALHRIQSRVWLALVLLVILATTFDLIENSQLFDLFNEPVHSAADNRSSWTIFVPAFLKLICFFSAVIYFFIKTDGIHGARHWLQRLSSLLRSFVFYGWRFRIVLMGLLVLYFALSLTNQGQDLLVTINTSDWGIFWLFFVTSILAVLNWHLPKIYDNMDDAGLTKLATSNLQFQAQKQDKLEFARLLGAITYLIPAVSVLITMQDYHISYPLDDIPPVFWLLLFIILYVNALRYNWLDSFYKPKGIFSLRRYLISMAVVFLFIVYWGRSEETRAPFYLIYLSMGFLLLSYAFVITASYRTCIKAVGHIAIAPLILSAGLLASAVFIAFNFEPVVFYLTRNDRFYTLPVVMAGLIAYTLTFSFLLALGRKMKIQLITLFLLLVIYKSATSINNIHQVHLMEANRKEAPPSLRDYATQWLQKRQPEISRLNQQYPGQGYPVFFVNAYGGGIKAAAWTTMVIGRLDQLLRQSGGTSTTDFQHHVFSFSGASGGTIGLSILHAARQDSLTSQSRFYPGQAIKLFRHDYLTATLAGLLGRDAFMSLLGIKLYPDRARLQERNWEAYMAAYQINYQVPFFHGASTTSTDVPLLFSNTYDINTGAKGILAPVQLYKKDFPGSVLVQHLLPPGKDLYLSTAAFVSARFPYVSPTAKFNEQYHFTDGGTLENSGAETSLQVYRVFEAVLDSLRNRDPAFNGAAIKINFLSLPNSVPVMDSVQRVKNLYEPLAPALGLLNSTNGNTLKADTINRYLAQKNNWNYYSINPVVKRITSNVWPVLPLGWQISDYALQQMEVNILDPKSPIYQVLSAFPTYQRQPPTTARLPD